MADFYTTVASDLDDLALGLRVLDAKSREMRRAFTARRTPSLHRAACDLTRLTEQLGALSGGLAARTGASLRAQPDARNAAPD